MLTALTKGVLSRVVIWIAALAIFAFVAPPVALAFAPTQHAVYCLTHEDHGVGLADHDQAVYHHRPGELDHEKHRSGYHPQANCCGPFCVTAFLLASFRHGFEHAWAGTPVFWGLRTSFSGQTPDRLDRPPISRLSS
jgi:hypothetical protein